MTASAETFWAIIRAIHSCSARNEAIATCCTISVYMQELPWRGTVLVVRVCCGNLVMELTGFLVVLRRLRRRWGETQMGEIGRVAGQHGDVTIIVGPADVPCAGPSHVQYIEFC